MNNQRYLGSALFIIDLDVNYKFQKEMENEDNKSIGKSKNKIGSEKEYSLPAIK